MTRPVPTSGEKIPVIGLGTSRVFEVGGSESELSPLGAVVAQLASVENSVLDTSPMYGEAESVAGALMEEAGMRGRLFVATKVWTTGREAGVSQMERSMQRLRTDRLDLIQDQLSRFFACHLSPVIEMGIKYIEFSIRFSILKPYPAAYPSTGCIPSKAAFFRGFRQPEGAPIQLSKAFMIIEYR